MRSSRYSALGIKTILAVYFVFGSPTPKSAEALCLEACRCRDPATNPRNLPKPPNQSPRVRVYPLPPPPPRPLGSESCSRLWHTRAPLDPSKSFAKMCLICLWAHLSPIEVAMLTTLAQKTGMLMIMLRKTCHDDDICRKKA